MANSSEWVGAFAALADPAARAASAPAWLAQVGTGARFRETLPFGDPAPELEPAPLPPAPDPHAAAVKAAFAKGKAEGRAEAAAQADERAARHRALRLTFHALDEAALGVLAEDLAATVMALTEAVLGEAAVDRAGLLARCAEAARRIGGAAESLALHCHPEDIALIGPEGLAGWRIVPDPALARGALLMESPEGAVSDGPEEWRRAIAAAVRG
jgi:flagellar assembly protein FliH